MDLATAMRAPHLRDRPVLVAFEEATKLAPPELITIKFRLDAVPITDCMKTRRHQRYQSAAENARKIDAILARASQQD